MWMSDLRLGPNWIVPPFDVLLTCKQRPPPSRGYKALSACNRRAGTPLYGGLLVRYRLNQVRFIGTISDYFLVGVTLAVTL